MIRQGRDYESLIWTLERSARENPGRYKSRVAMLASLGYAYVFCVLCLLIAALFLLVLIGRWVLVALGAVTAGTLFLVLCATVPIMILIRAFVDALMVEISKPDGAELRRDAAPGIFRLIDDVAAKLDVPPFDHVILYRQFNAGVIQHPKYGLFGKNINYLVIGIPLLKALSPEQFTAVLAHELGHISGNHSRFNRRIYHFSNTWHSLMAGIKKERALISPFLRWYVPYFDAYSFALRRADEYEADRRSAEIAGADVTASALVAINTLGPYWKEKYWPQLTKRAEQVDTPDIKPFSLVFESEYRPSHEDRIRWYRRALDEKSGIADVHPCLGDRLAALGYRVAPDRGSQTQLVVPLPEIPKESAAQRYLGKWLDRYTRMLDDGWSHYCADEWRKAHEEAQIARDRLQELTARYKAGNFDPDDFPRFIHLIDDIEGRAPAMATLRQHLADHLDDSGGHFLMGLWLLEADDIAGVAALERAAELDPKRKLRAYREISAFFTERGQASNAQPYNEFIRKNVSYDRSVSGRIILRQSDRFVYHSLTPEAIGRIKQHLNTVIGIRTAYIMQRQKRETPDRPVYVIIIEPDNINNRNRNFDEFAMQIRQGIDLPGDIAVEFASGQMKWLKKVASEMRSSLILENS